MGFINFFKTSAPKPLRADLDEAGQKKYHRSLALQSFIAGTLGYSLYYVCRTSLNVMKKPILDSGMLDATQLGIIGSALLFAYANSPFEKPLKNGRFPWFKKTLKKIRKNACTENPVLVSYSPVAPLRATPERDATIDL